MALLLAVMAVIFFASLLQGAVGFGYGLVSMPLLALLLEAQPAAALTALCGTWLAGLMLFQHRKALHFGEAAGLIAAAAVGVPAGVFVLAHAPRQPLLIGLGVVIAGFSLYSLFQPKPLELKDRRWRFLAGFLGGVLGGAYNTAGPPVVIYGAMRRWPPQRFMAVTQAFFLPIALMVTTGHALAGFWTREVLTMAGLALPGVVAATFIGRRIAAGLSPERLSKAVYGLCVALGLMIVAANLAG